MFGHTWLSVSRLPMYFLKCHANAHLGALDDMVGVSAADQLLDTSNYQPNALGWSYLQVGY